MDFFARQDAARRHSRRMVLLLVLAVLAIVAAVDLLILLAFGITQSAPDGSIVIPWRPLLWVSAGVIALVGIASLYRIAALRSGGSTVARELHATPVPPDTADPALRRLRNVVEEVAIASGVPVPDIYVLEHEQAINAFAAGYGPADAAVCVTQGCLQVLDRDELQGVIAHEFSHVLNGDMRLNTRLIGVVFGIVIIGVAGRKLLDAAWLGGGLGGRNRRGNSGTAIWLLGLGLVVIGAIGVFFARLIKASVSRARESLADAAAVQFTRQTRGIAGALKKIGAFASGSQLRATPSEEVSHMLFGEGGDWGRLFATHPPLEVRIRALEPGFQPREFERMAARWADVVQTSADDPRASASGLLPRDLLQGVATATTAASADAATSVRLSAAAMPPQVGNAGPEDYAIAATLHGGIPDPLKAAARTAQQAAALVLALALAADAATRARQLALLAVALSPADARALPALADAVQTLDPRQRLPLAALAFPALRRRTRDEIQRLLVAVQQLAHADGKVGVDEYCLATLVRVQVLDALDPARGFVPGALKLDALRGEAVLVLMLVAHFGHDDEAAAARAFQLGMQTLLPGETVAYAPPADWQQGLDAALLRLDRLPPAGKELLVGALTRAVREDGQLRLAEAELLRVVCAAVHCPLPLLLRADTAPTAA